VARVCAIIGAQAATAERYEMAGWQRPPASTYLSLSLREGELLQFDSLPDDPFDPLVDTGLAMQPGQESCARRQFARNRKEGRLGPLDPNACSPGRVVIRLGNHKPVRFFLIQHCGFLFPFG